MFAYIDIGRFFSPSSTESYILASIVDAVQQNNTDKIKASDIKMLFKVIHSALDVLVKRLYSSLKLSSLVMGHKLHPEVQK